MRVRPLTWSIDDTSITVDVSQPPRSHHITRLCSQLRLIHTSPSHRFLVCRGDGLRDADLGTLELLANLGLVARHRNLQLRLPFMPPRLEALLALTGLQHHIQPDL